MTTLELLRWATIIVVGANVGLLLVTVVHRVASLLRRRRREQVRSALRPLLIRLMVDGVTTLPPLTRRRMTMLEVIATDFLGKVRGEARQALVTLLRERGADRVALRRMRWPGAFGRAAAAELLGSIGTFDHVGPLVARLGDRDPEVRRVACRSIGRIGDPVAVGPMLRALDALRPVPFGVVAVALLRTGPPATPALRTALGDESASARAMAAEMLGVHGAVEATADLVRRVDDTAEAVEVRVRAARSLGRIGSPRGVPALGRAVADGGPTGLRAVAARALGDIGGAEAAALLAPLLGDASHVVAANAAHALPRTGAAGRRTLAREASRDGRGGAHAREALALAALRGPAPSAVGAAS